MNTPQQNRVKNLQEILNQLSDSAQKLNPKETDAFKQRISALERSLKDLNISFYSIKMVCERGYEDQEIITV